MPQSPASEDDSPFAKSPTDRERGRSGNKVNVQDEVNAQFTDEMDSKK